MKKKFLALMLVASMLLSSTSVTAREIAPTVGSGTTKVTNEQETPPTVKKTPTVPSTTEALKEETTEKSINTTTPDMTSPTTVTKTDAKPVPSVDVVEKVDEKVKETELNSVDETEKMTKELLIKADKKSEIPKDGKILSSYENTYLVSFPNTDTAKEVYENKNTDASLNIPFGIATGSDKASAVVEPDVLNNLEETLKTNDTKGFKITDDDYSIAVIDTGMPKSSENVEFVSMLDDKGYDDHGHGTMMLESIRKQNADAKILSIKALDKNGYGDAATIYAAIKYAIERNVDVINLSISGFATEGNKIIEDVIKDAILKGIIVIGAAGNDNLPASAFIPGGIDEAIIVGACNENNERKLFSNYGITVDYYANAGSTSEASAIVAGTLSANNGDINVLNNTFFKTPDLSIFEEDLKKYKTSDEIIENSSLPEGEWDDCSDGGSEIINNEKMKTDEEYLLKRLNIYINTGGFHVAANASINTATAQQNPKNLMMAKYRDVDGNVVYTVDEKLIKTDKITVAGTNWSSENYSVKIDATDMVKTNLNNLESGMWAVYSLKDSQGHDRASSTTESTDAPCTIVIEDCIRSSATTELYDWVITITKAEFGWGSNWATAGQVKDDRKKCIAVHLRDKKLPEFTTGAVCPELKYNDDGSIKSEIEYKVDSANKFWFKMGVRNVTSGAFLTGFSDLDQWQLYPVGQRKDDGNGNQVRLEEASGGNYKDQTTSNSFDERIDIINTGQLTTKDVWLYNNTKLGPKDEGSGLRIHSTQFTNVDNDSIGNNSPKATILFSVAPAGTTELYWNGCRCQTEIGLSMENSVPPSTITTYVDFETTTPGVYADNRAVDSDTKYAGEPYSYTYDGTGANVAYHDVSKTWAAPGTPYDTDTKVVSTQFTLGNQTFQLHVPRIRYTYKFDLNKPASATSNPTGQPSDITKPAGAQCGDYDALPSLKGWTFTGFYTDRTGGTQYVSTEEMWSNKTFYAHWEPKKYYIRYNANGSTNFNENATNGMQAGEYTQNVVTGSTAYQIFTYDAAGEALRANGFTRRGYDYVCWNTTAIRTGTDLNPGYVKPANVNWIKGDNTDTPTAALDGTHTYPVVDLYAVWQQKPGTETLKVVSEETGNPVSGVSLKLTNTYNNTQISTGTTGADGTVTVSNLHWFPYKWESTAVPAGYKDMQDVTFSINPTNTSDESFLTVNNERILYMKHVKLTINSIVDDIIDKENAPNFMYHVTGTDVAGVAHSYDVMVQTSTDTKKGTNIVPVNSGSEEPYMFAGNYTVTQYDVSRYIPRDAQNVKNVTPNGINANANLTNYDDAEVTFPYGIKQYGGFSGVHSLINKLTK